MFKSATVDDDAKGIWTTATLTHDSKNLSYANANFASIIVSTALLGHAYSIIS